MRLERCVVAEATPGVPFMGSVVANKFSVRPVLTWTPRGSPLGHHRRAFQLPVCSVDGVVLSTPTGTQIDLTVGVMWPLPLVLLCWVVVYVSGLTSRSFGRDDVRVILPMALVVFGVCTYFDVGVMQGCVREVQRIAMVRPEADGRQEHE
jgi:hypothetical protein